MSKVDDKPVFRFKSRPKTGQKPEFEPFTTIPKRFKNLFQ